MSTYRDSNRRNASSYTEQADAVVSRSNAPLGKNEDVEFSMDQADAADMKALDRARQADERAEQS
ncbi:protease [Paenibacillus apiarius]|uniref:Protease n=1 Tax=Paenibacillus apiarius TaxID=46240 RepID=A0ABT4DL12_9BACL|nr:protease [Paenibacillus apiarius]MCY9513511.1 protease [Paenibacillus apiarius]MCY9518062.1 protease [Paenibacillus apiarius]MCY9551537.1 protease [Paenibacillus apiarius]MCY9558691.1 protease [Paenibacillus apiarius]MCY9683995.1 protease [Paenibacillus apiarius]